MLSFAKQTPIDVHSDVDDNTVVPVTKNVPRTFFSTEAAKSDAFREQETRKRKPQFACQPFDGQRDESLNDPAPSMHLFSKL